MADPKRKRDPERTKAAILNAAEKRFSRSGFAGTSMSDIAAAAKVTQSLLHHYFGTKRALWRAVFLRYAASYLDYQTSVLRGGGALEAALENDFRFWLDHPVLLRLQGWAVVEGGDLMGADRDAMYRPFMVLARKAQAAGRLRADIDPAHLVVIGAAAVTFWIQYRDEIASRKAKGGRDERFLQDMLKILFEGAQRR